jgi:putative transcriptional regulator
MPHAARALDFAPAYAALLLDYTAHALDPAAELVVRTHLAMNAQARAVAALWGALADQAAAEGGEMAALRPGARDAVMARLDDGDDAAPAPPARPFDAGALEAAPWRGVIPGLRTCDLPIPGEAPSGTQLRCFRMGPGFTVPRHAHGGGGEELTLVLSGAFADGGRVYAAGDLLVVDDEAHAHAPQACPERGCTCLVVTRGPLVFEGLAARILGALV